jgi:putative transposase
MGRPLSKDLRERIVKAVEGGESRNATAKRFAVSVSAVIKLMQRWQRTGSLEAGQMGGWKDYALAGHEELVRALIKANPDMTLEELGAALGRNGIRVGRSSIGRFLIARKLTLKKSRFMPPSRAART